MLKEKVQQMDLEGLHEIWVGLWHQFPRRTGMGWRGKIAQKKEMKEDLNQDEWVKRRDEKWQSAGEVKVISVLFVEEEQDKYTFGRRFRHDTDLFLQFKDYKVICLMINQSMQKVGVKDFNCFLWLQECIFLISVHVTDF